MGYVDPGDERIGANVPRPANLRVRIVNPNTGEVRIFKDVLLPDEPRKPLPPEWVELTPRAVRRLRRDGLTTLQSRHTLSNRKGG